MTETPAGAAPPSPPREGQRIAKVMARAGLCSRRDAEAWILEGRVSVNGKILESPAFNVSAEDDVRVDGQPLREAERTRLFLFHKPKGLVTTARDPEGRPTIFDALPEDLPRVVAVGRLDINTEGLLLLTNDGGLARVLELPATGWLRRYRVRAHGAIDQARLDTLREGVTIDGVHYAGIDARLEHEQGSNVWMTMGLREGKNREIKRVLEHLGMSVNRLIRVSFGPFELGDLAEGEVAEVRSRVLRDQLGAKLAREAGVNFDAAIVDHAPPPAPAPAPKRGERGAGGERPRAGRRGPPDREAFAARPPARRSEPEPARLPRKRKHVTALRAEAEVEIGGPRRRVERGATSDRKGREVKVERIVTAAPAGARRPKGAESGPKRRPRRSEESASSTRAARPFRKGPPREGAPEREARPPRSRGEGRPFETRAPGGEGRPPSRGGGKPFGERARSGEGRAEPRGEGRSFEKRAPSGEGRPGPRAGGKAFGERPRSGEGRGAPRAEGRSFEKRAPGGEGRAGPRGEGRSFEKRAPSGEGRPGPRAGAKAFGDRPRSGEGRSFDKRGPGGEGRAGPRGEGRSFEKRAPSGEGRPGPRAGAKAFGDRPRSGEGRGAPRAEGRSFDKRGPAGEGRPPSRGGGKPFAKRPPSGEARSPPRGGKPGGKRPPRRP